MTTLKSRLSHPLLLGGQLSLSPPRPEWYPLLCPSYGGSQTVPETNAGTWRGGGPQNNPQRRTSELSSARLFSKTNQFLASPIL